MIEHPFGWWSFVPPIVAIVLAIVTRRILFSLLFGIFVGALILANGDPIVAMEQFCSEHLWSKLTDNHTLHIFFFTMLMGVMVGVINRGAGMKGLVQALTPIAGNRCRGQLVTWLLGLFVFFDDYANTMLLGNTLRPLTDRLKISREKLAYIVDSTAAPVSGLALVSTWVAGEIGYVTDGIQNIDATVNWNPFTLFVASIPYRFYVLWALVFVPMVALLGRDFGPMLWAERDSDGLSGKPDEGAPIDPTAPDDLTPARWFNAVVPILVTVAAVVWFLYSSGLAACTTDTIYKRWDWGVPSGITTSEIPESLHASFARYDEDVDGAVNVDEFARWHSETDDFSFTLSDIFGNADSYGSLLWGALAGATAAVLFVLPQRIISLNDMLSAGAAGALKMIPALGILWLASCLSTMTGKSPNEDDAAQWEQVQLVASAMSDQGANPDQIAAYLHGQGAEALPVAMNVLNNGQDRETLQSSLIAAGFAKSRTAAAVRFFRDSDAGPIVEFPYQRYRLYSGQFLTSQIQLLQENSQFVADNFTSLLPTLVFLLSSLIAFSTGTSWGTMGIVMPLVIPLAYAQLAGGGSEVTADHPILLCTIGGVLAGSIFGDHCSPISDTTVLSSQASGCDHIAHVRTQLPYALLVAFVSVVCGTLPIGYGVPVWMLLPIGVVAMLIALRLLGSKVADPEK